MPRVVCGAAGVAVWHVGAWATVPRPSWVATATYATFAMLQCDAGPMGKVVCLRHAQS